MHVYKKLIIIAIAIVSNIGVGFSQGSPYEKPEWGMYTEGEDGFLLAHVSNWPEDGKLVIDSAIKPREARLLSEPDQKINIKLIDGKLTVLLPKKASETGVSVVKIQLMPNEDWANLKRYKKANEELKALGEKEKRVVFMGNSITEKWVMFHGEFFTENNYIGRGISGQTSSQMLVRFKPDVVNLNPEVVVIHAGTNDIAGNRGPITVPEIADNIFSMAELAKANNIKVVLASVLPASSYSWSPSIEPKEKISRLNALIESYAKKNDMVYLDYYSHMVNEEKGLKEDYGRDTVHPNLTGYAVMEPLVQEAIKEVLRHK
ncbi:SGNH/GDSL hydrolase family protein [Maribacter polysaccharolyticus]|uniref:SGNH/GDSL hydrolase family protein n=1 Tax=Maribacter polysaccharolyticus TaxID=3020831 RepID=UPI00237F42FC|nr:SGNH/GDSL hydrolase family protein [Maribacter polysaccharolyticus]MDE3740988.1 SGNH/GDSL hydrolase family protein [Maribacter polysaccharolyticus]